MASSSSTVSSNTEIIDLVKAKEEYFRVRYVEFDAKGIGQQGESNERSQAKLHRLTEEWTLLENGYIANNERVSGLSKSTPKGVVQSGYNSPAQSKSDATPTRKGTGEEEANIRIGEVYIMTHNAAFDFVPTTDVRLMRGTLLFMDLLYMFRVFTRETTSTTYLHVYGVSTERSVRLRIQRNSFDPEGDLGIATLFLEPSLTEMQNELGSSMSHLFDSSSIEMEVGYPVSKAPVLTGTSELDADTPVTVFEEPQGYQQVSKLLGNIKRGTYRVNGRNELTYRAYSDGPRTRITVSEESTRRKLFFTVYRSTFEEEEDMTIATTLLDNVRARTPTFRPAVKSADIQRMMDVYSSPEKLNSPAKLHFTLPGTEEKEFEAEVEVEDKSEKKGAVEEGKETRRPTATTDQRRTGKGATGPAVAKRRVAPGKNDPGTHLSMKYAPLLTRMRGFY